jgi:uncharacterized membrane protein
MTSEKELFSEAQQGQIAKAVSEAEKKTSGEIRVYIEEQCAGEVLDRASFVFEQMEMHKTKERNGVLFYVATKDHKFAILGDAGINAVVGSGFWDKIRDAVIDEFRHRHFTEGLCKGIYMAGEALQHYFPYRSGDTNELSDDIVFGGIK